MIIDAPDSKSSIIEYLKSPTVETNSKSIKLRIRVARYILIDNILYKKSFSRSLSYKALKEGYYWPTMKKNLVDFVRKYDKCQRFVKTTHQPPEQLSAVVAPWPFA